MCFQKEITQNSLAQSLLSTLQPHNSKTKQKEYKMKNTALITIAILLSLTIFTSGANAQSSGRGNQTAVTTNWVDLNGDGLCDNVGTSLQGSSKAGKGYGKKDGSGLALRPQDGTGFGNKGGNANVSGVHDGTGPKGSSARRGGK